ncbi:hypothetical protein J4E83_005962 [Alternaria metachromatica]|uniref:uncharacterized protein n=1 Tax=Alternaria metachromatica TaxID=283354 RepID=UPI0020C26A0F|nr:uncharacterized protein J4E83_005962 [Alternaria metachromatica]KAI4619010.1 hypothetical protein J4E83_005962 [Alternaria metachromatica]
MFGPFRLTNPLSGGLLWKIPWRLSRHQKYRQRERLRHVDTVVGTLDTALRRMGQSMKKVERWKMEMPTEAEMLPKDKYTVFDRKVKRYRKGIHILELLKANTITVEAYAQSLLDRIHDRDNIVEAWAHLDMPTQYGSPIYEGHRSGFDSLAVAILRSAGALIFGKTTTTEFSVPNSGPPTANPHDPSRTPGGSSCGSAAAVADMQIPLALGVQTGGSVIRPAAYCGIFAMKPTYNAISTSGQKTVSSTFDTIGFFARSIPDLQLLADVFSFPDDQRPGKVCLGDISVALVKTPMWSYAGPGTINAMHKTAAILQNHGVQAEEMSLPDGFGNADILTRSQNAIIDTETALAFREEYRSHKGDLNVSIRNLVEKHSKHTDAGKEKTEALDKLAHLRAVFDAIAAQYSVIIAPSAVDEAPVGLGDMGSPVFNTLWTVS